MCTVSEQFVQVNRLHGFVIVMLTLCISCVCLCVLVDHVTECILGVNSVWLGTRCSDIDSSYTHTTDVIPCYVVSLLGDYQVVA